MDKLTEKIHMQYLQAEIMKMQKTFEDLDKMIDESKQNKDSELVETLQDLQKITFDTIEHKKEELKKLYNIEIKADNN